MALLLCQLNRQAHRDWILEQFWPENSRSAAMHRLENIFSCLRKLLRPPSGIGDFETAQQFAFQAIDKAVSTQQHYVIPQCMTLAQTLQQKGPEKPYAIAITDYARLALQHN